MPLTRRAPLAGAALVGATLAAPHVAMSRTARTFCLVHGTWHGGWAWGPTVEALRAMGHVVTAPDLPGMGGRRAASTVKIGLHDPSMAIRDHLMMRDLRDVVLVAHSYAGCVLSDLLGQGEDRIAHAVYFDALVPGDGEALASFVPDDARVAVERAAEGGQLIPVRPREDWAELWGLTGAAADFAAPRLPPHPPLTFLETVRGDPFARPMRRTFIKAARNPNPLFKAIRDRLAEGDGFEMREIEGHHDVMAIDGASTAKSLTEAASTR